MTHWSVASQNMVAPEQQYTALKIYQLTRTAVHCTETLSTGAVVPVVIREDEEGITIQSGSATAEQEISQVP